jgi:hypothetical protein
MVVNLMLGEWSGQRQFSLLTLIAINNNGMGQVFTLTKVQT